MIPRSIAGAVTALPGIDALRRYDRSALTPDLVAGATVWALLVPQGLAYAGLAGVDPVVGMYTAIGAMLVYFLLGGVSHLNVGPEATVALMSAAAIAPLAAGDAVRFGALSALLALIAGIVLMGGWLLRLGWLSRLLSRPLLVGYLTGTAVIMIIGQVDDLLGIELAARDDPIAEAREILTSLDEVQVLTAAVGVAVIGGVFLLRRITPAIPAYLVVVMASIAASVTLGLADQGVAVVGDITGGLPSLGLPALGLDEVGALIVPALAIAVLAFADSGVTSKVLAARSGQPYVPDRELLALGAAGIGSSLLGGIAVNGSGSRSFAAQSAGAATRLFGLVVIVLTLLTLAFLTPLIEPLPKAALAGIIIVVAIGLIDVPAFRALWRLDRVESLLALLTVAAVLMMGLVAGLGVVVIVSLLLVAKDAALPVTTELVAVPGTRSYRARASYPDARAIPGLVIFRVDGPLFFANIDVVTDALRAAVHRANPPARAVLLDAEAVYDLDTTAVAGLSELIDELAGRGVAFLIARLKARPAGYLARAGIIERIGPESVHLEVSDGVRAFTSRLVPSGDSDG